MFNFVEIYRVVVNRLTSRKYFIWVYFLFKSYCKTLSSLHRLALIGSKLIKICDKVK